MEKKEKQERAEDFSQGEGLKQAGKEVKDLSPLPVVNSSFFLFVLSYISAILGRVYNVSNTFGITSEVTFLSVNVKKVHVATVINLDDLVFH